MSDMATLNFIHPYYVASDLAYPDAAFDDGKARAISTLNKRIRQIEASTLQDYEAAFLGRGRLTASEQLT